MSPVTRLQRSLQPGDMIRVGRGVPLIRLDEDVVDFLRVHYDTRSPGLARVVAAADDGVVLSLWGHRFLMPEPPDSPRLRPLGPLARWCAPERLGEALLAREIRRGRVVMDPSRPSPEQPLIRAWLRRTRGPLPILDALGGRIRPPVLRRWKARLFGWLARHGLMPAAPGFVDHGLLIDRIGRTVTLGYGDGERRLWLDRIQLHKNHTLHLVGIDLDKGEQRTFRLDRVHTLGIPPLGAVEPSGFYWELRALCDRREGWTWYWNRYRAERGLPPAPPVGRIGRVLSDAARLWSTARREAGPRLAVARIALRYRCADVTWQARQRLGRLRTFARVLWWRVRPPVPPPAGPGAESAVWRKRLLRAIATVEAGGTEQITALLPMNVLLADPWACHAWLHHMLERTLEEAKADPAGHPLAPRLVAETLALVPATPAPPLESRRRAAAALYARLVEAQPGRRRISVHATRRAGKDARLLLCECCLDAVYRLDGSGSGYDGPAFDDGWPALTTPWSFHRANAHFVTRWDNSRFRMDATSAPRLREIIAWWDGWMAVAETSCRKRG